MQPYREWHEVFQPAMTLISLTIIDECPLLRQMRWHEVQGRSYTEAWLLGSAERMFELPRLSRHNLHRKAEFSEREVTCILPCKSAMAGIATGSSAFNHVDLLSPRSSITLRSKHNASSQQYEKYPLNNTEDIVHDTFFILPSCRWR